MATNLIDLIDKVNADDLPTNEFTVEDNDPMVILGKLNEVIAYLQTLQSTINSSDSKANEALQKAIQAVADATQALSVANGIDDKATQALANAVEAVSSANTAISASNTALSTANTAIDTANTAISTANRAEETAQSAETKADNAVSTANTASATATSAKNTADGIDAKATTALSNSQTAVSTANNANATAQDALNQVVAGLGTKVYRDSTLLSTLDIKPIEDDIADNTTAITALQTGKVDKVSGKQLSTEDFTTAEKNKLAGLNNYNDTQVQADITALQTRATNIETKNTEQDTTLSNLQTQINTKVTKVDGKGLSTNDFTTDLLTKLNGIASGAQVNTVDSVAGYTGAVSASNLISAILTGKVGYGIAIDSQSISLTGYIKFNNGLLIQWGNLKSSAGTLTFPKKFKSVDSYTVQISSQSTNNAGMANGFIVGATNGGSYRCYGNKGWWFAIGLGE